MFVFNRSYQEVISMDCVCVLVCSGSVRAHALTQIPHVLGQHARVCVCVCVVSVQMQSLGKALAADGGVSELAYCVRFPTRVGNVGYGRQKA